MSTPKNLAIYYGWPSAVNGSNGVIADAVNVFKDYDMVVFGAGLEDPSHGDHSNTVQIISDLQPNTKVYGYIDSEASNTINWGKIDSWTSMGVSGILCDKFGYDWNVDRNRQNVLVEYIHYKGLEAFVNAWNPDDVFDDSVDAQKNPLGKAHMMTGNDWYLAESFQIVNGVYQDTTVWKTKSDKMASYKTSVGTNMAVVTTSDGSTFDQDKWDYAYYSCVLYGFDAAGWGEDGFSAASASLPWREKKNILGTKFLSSINEDPTSVFSRQTNVGILVDTVNHTVSHTLP